MSKQEDIKLLKIQTCVLKVNIHCDGCKQKVKKLLQKIDGVYTTSIDAEQGKVTVSGNVDPATLIKKLQKKGKYAELWGTPKGGNNNNGNQLSKQLQGMNIDNGKGQKGGNPPKGGKDQKPQQQPQMPQMQQLLPHQQQQLQHLQQLQLQQMQQMQQLQQMQQMKGMKDPKLPPQMKDMKGMPPFKDPKTVKFNLPEGEMDGSDGFDEYDDEFDDFDEDDDFDDAFDMDQEELMKAQMKAKAMNGQGMGHFGNGGGGAPHQQALVNGHPMNGNKPNGAGAVNANGNGKKGGGGDVIMQSNKVMGGSNEGKSGNNGKKGGDGNNGGNQNQAGVGAPKNGGKNSGAQDPKHGASGGGGGGGGGNNKNATPNGHGNNNGGAKKGGGPPKEMGHVMGNVGPQGFREIDFSAGGPGANMGQMRNMHMPMGHQMGSIPAVQGLPAGPAMMHPGGYFRGPSPDIVPGNPYHQQYLAAMMMRQQQQNGNERFQPMMYARPPPAVAYFPAPPTPAPDPYTHIFSDENTNSCTIM